MALRLDIAVPFSKTQKANYFRVVALLRKKIEGVEKAVAMVQLYMSQEDAEQGANCVTEEGLVLGDWNDLASCMDLVYVKIKALPNFQAAQDVLEDGQE